MTGPTSPHLLGLDEHGATFPATSSLVTKIAELRDQHSSPQDTLVLLATSLSNGTEIADIFGPQGLETVTADVARRALQHAHVPARLLRASPLGGFLAAVVVRRDLATAEVAALVADLRGLVAVRDDHVWPVVTVGARACDDDNEIWDAIREVRATVFTAGREAPGTLRWHSDRPGVSVDDDLALVRDLALTLLEHPEQLDLAYQPVQELRTQAVMGAEALLRWHHPERGTVSPILAIETAERTGLIVPLGRVILDRAVAQTAAWRRDVRPDFRMHVNVSPLELREPSYADGVEATLARWDVPPQNLLLEVTETALLTEDPTIVATLHELRALGVGLGIDDFGTGYSSIAHLHRLPFDTVKIDRSLIAGISSSPREFTLTRAVLGLVGTMGVMVVAEGIENALQAAHLRAMGCTFAQGYHLGRPVPAAAFLPTLPDVRDPDLGASITA